MANEFSQEELDHVSQITPIYLQRSNKTTNAEFPLQKRGCLYPQPSGYSQAAYANGARFLKEQRFLMEGILSLQEYSYRASREVQPSPPPPMAAATTTTASTSNDHRVVGASLVTAVPDVAIDPVFSSCHRGCFCH